MNTKITRILQILIILGAVFFFAFYFYTNSDKYIDLFRFSGVGIFTLFLLSLMFPVINGIQNTLLYRSLGIVDISYWEGFLITAAASFANQLPIPGGIISKGYYLKSRHGLSYTKFTSSTFATFFCFFSTNGLLGLSVLIYWMVIKSVKVPTILVVVFLLMGLSILVFRIPVSRVRFPEKINNKIHQLLDGWKIISIDRILFLNLVVLQIILVFLLSLRYWIVFHMLSQEVMISQSLLFASASILTQIVSLAPGGLGVREAIVAAMASVLGFDTAVSVLAIGIDRLVITTVIVFSGWLSTLSLGKKIAVDNSNNT